MVNQKQIDILYYKSKKEGYIARSVYKLKKIDERYHILKSGQRVLDLGCHPGSWLQYTSNKIGNQGIIMGIDKQPPSLKLPINTFFLLHDIITLTSKKIKSFIPSFDVVLSDVAPRTTGITHIDISNSYKLTAKTLNLALEVLNPGGSVVTKIYFGPKVNDLIQKVKLMFTIGKAHKPKTSRPQSKEIYIIGYKLKNNYNFNNL